MSQLKCRSGSQKVSMHSCIIKNTAITLTTSKLSEGHFGFLTTAMFGVLYHRYSEHLKKIPVTMINMSKTRALGEHRSPPTTNKSSKKNPGQKLGLDHSQN